MAFWSGETLEQRMPALVTEFSKHRIDCSAYTLRMGRQYYLSASELDVDTNKVRVLAAGDSIAIPSGQFAVLLTEETVTVPTGAIAFISMKNGLKSRGLVNVSGFHVDPGYSAPLKFAVFNGGPSTICVKQGEDCFLIWYADLDREESEFAKKENQNRQYGKGITSNDVSSLTGAVKTISVLAKKVDQLDSAQVWMKWFIGVLTVAAGIVIAVTVFFAEAGIKSYSSAQSCSISQSPTRR